MSSTCPICAKDFPLKEIQSHVDKCLFLNSEAGGSTKRTVQDISSQFITPKRPKPNERTPSHSVPTPSSQLKDVPAQQMPNKPLAEQMRPNELSNFYGQQHILSSGSSLRNLLENDNPPSMILWGPPGCGKTTLAHIIHNRSKSKNDVRFVKLSATLAGVNDVKEVVNVAKNELKMFKKKTILFMDEIHRFNKLQQDIFLPNVELGVITLIGATTENPSFSLNNALLSRCRVFVLDKLQVSDIMNILNRAVKNIIVDKPGLEIDADGLKWLAEVCDGDARVALNSLQLAVESCTNTSITLEHIKEGVKRSHLLYDKKGEEHYNIISALHKSIRASDDNAALYWVSRMMEGGEDPLFIARRLVRAASEDIGLAEPLALSMAVSAMQGVALIGRPECDCLLAQTAVFLARAPKSQEVYRAMKKANAAIQEHKGPLPSVPLHLRNATTKLMREIGCGRGYNMRHKDESNLTYMPQGMENVSFFENEEEE